MKKVLFIYFILISSLSFGQAVKWGTPAVFSASDFFNTHRYSCVRVDQDGFYLVHQKNIAQYSIEKFDLNLKKVEASELEKLPLYREIRKEIEYVFDLKGETYAISVVKEFKYNTNYYFLEKLNKETLKFEEQKKLYTFKYRNTENEVFSVGFRVSPNRKKLLVTKIYYDKSKDHRRYFFAVYDENLELEWDEVVKVPIEKKTEYILSSDFVLSNLGDVYMYNTISIQSAQYPGWKDKIIAICEKGKRIKIHDLTIKKGIGTRDCELFLTDENDLIISGFYTNRAKHVKDELLGNYHLKLDRKTGEIESEVYHPFVTANYKMVLGTGTYDKKMSSKKEDYSMSKAFTYSYNHLITKDKTIYHVVRLYSNSDRITGICVYKITSGGKVEWIRQIPINGSTNMGAQLVDDKLHIVYNDHVDNEGLKFNKVPQKIPNENGTKDGCLVLVTLDETGKAKHQIVSRYEEGGGKVETFYSFQRDVNYMLLYGNNEKKKEMHLGLIRVD